MPNGHARDDRWRQLFFQAWALIGILILVIAAFFALLKVSPALVPFVFALVIVYVFRAPVAALERRGFKRGLAIGSCYLVAIATLVVAGLFIIPPLIEQVRQFLMAFPGYYDKAYALWQQLQAQYSAVALPSWVNDALLNLRDSIASKVMSWSSALANTVFSVGSGAVALLFNSFLALVIAFWMLKDLDAIKREVVSLGGPKRKEEASILGSKVSNVLGGYLRGQFIVSISTGILVSVGLSIMGVPYALVLGLLAAVLNVIPWFGPIITEIISAISAAFVSPWLALAAVAWIVVVQQLTDMFITPRVMSEQVDLHPLLVIFSLLVGSALAGLVGLLLAIPVAAIAKGLFVYYFEKWTDSKLTTQEGAFFKEKKPPCGPDSAGPPECEPETETTEEHE